MNEKYGTIYADPPWMERGSGKSVRGAQRHYNLMSTDDILTFMRDVPIADDAHIYLWVTNNFLEHGLRVLNGLGFRYVTNIVWVKDKIGLGQYFRGQHELCLFGVKGQPGYKQSENNQRSICDTPSVIHAPRTEHSRKPFVLYDIIEKTSPPPYVEVFGRTRLQNWDIVGDQIQDSLEMFA